MMRNAKKDERVTFWGQRSWSQCNKIYWKQHILGLLTRHLEEFLTHFHPTYRMMHSGMERDEYIKLLRRVRRSSYSGTTYTENSTYGHWTQAYSTQ